jgi:hypothetical protein
MRHSQFLVAIVLLISSSAFGFAQICTPPAQACAAGPNGPGGCYLAEGAQCLNGMICLIGASVCSPGANGDGGCFDLRTEQCDDGRLAKLSEPAPAPNLGAQGASTPPAASSSADASTCRSASGEDRIAILDALRSPVSSDLKTSVEFAVERARICSDWAFVIAKPQKKGGGAIRWAGTVCAGDTSHLAGALVRQYGSAWRLVEYALCPSDVAWSDWSERFKAPQALFDE